MQPEYQKILTILPVDRIDKATRHGLLLKPDIDAETWSCMVSNLVNLAGKTSRGRDTLTAWLGDLLAYGKGKYRGQITEYAKAAGLNAGTLRCAKFVASRIPVLCRHNTLSWSHHCEIGRAFERLDEIEKWIQVAVEEQLSTMELRKRIRMHLKGPTDNPPHANSAEAGPFILLRELRVMERAVRAHGKSWKDWPPETCGLALGEVKSLVEFIDSLSSKAGRDAPLRTAS